MVSFLKHANWKLSMLFQNYMRCQTRVIIRIRKRLNRGQICKVLSHVTLTCDVRPSKTIGHLTHAPRSFTYRIIAICEFKLELSFRNAPNWQSFEPCDLDLWPSKTIGHLTHVPRSFTYCFIAICELKLELSSGNGKIGNPMVEKWISFIQELFALPVATYY